MAVATTLSGKGLVSEEHPLSLGVFGYGGSRWALDAVCDDEVEVLVVIGSGLSQRDTMQRDLSMLPSRALVHIDTDPLLIGRTWPSEVPVLGDDEAAGLDAGREVRRAFVARIRAAGPRAYREDDTHSDAVPMHPARVVAELRDAFPDEGVLCVDTSARR